MFGYEESYGCLIGDFGIEHRLRIILIALFSHIRIVERVEKKDDTVGVGKVDRGRVGNGISTWLKMLTRIVIKNQILIHSVSFRYKI